jgi:periplasmic protein CpxP/Spy
MRRTALSIIITMTALSVIIAQPRRTPSERAKMLKEQLNLTDDQTSKIENLYTAADKKFQNESQNGFDREKFRAVMDSTNMEIKSLLTDKQKDEFDKLLAERRNRMRRNRPDQN